MICHFRPMTQPNPLKTKILDPLLTQSNPTYGSAQPMDSSHSAWPSVRDSVTVCVCAVVVVVTQSVQRVISVFEAKLQLPESVAKRLVLITVNFHIRMCLKQ